jgi:phage terminase large subunit-like protein
VVLEGTIVEPLIPAELWEKANPSMGYHVQISREVYEMEQRLAEQWVSMWDSTKEWMSKQQELSNLVNSWDQKGFFRARPEPTALFHSVFLRRFQKGAAQ